MFKNLDLIKKLYADFVECHMPHAVVKGKANSKRHPEHISAEVSLSSFRFISILHFNLSCLFSLSFSSVFLYYLQTDADLLTAIKRAGSELDCQVFMTLLR